MYGVVLLAALAAAEESAGWDHNKNCYPPVYDGGGYPGYHNHGGWGKPYGGYAWPGYGCPEYWGPAPVVTVPPEPVVVPPDVKQRDPDEEDDEDAAPSKNDRGAVPKKNGDRDRKNGKDEDADGAHHALSEVEDARPAVDDDDALCEQGVESAGSRSENDEPADLDHVAASVSVSPST